MNNNIQQVNLTEEQFFKMWVRMLQPFLSLREQEVQLLSKLLYHRYLITESISKENETGREMVDYFLFSPERRKMMREELKYEIYTFNNNLTILRKKNLVLKKTINKKIIPMVQKPFTNFKFTYSIDIIDNGKRQEENS